MPMRMFAAYFWHMEGWTRRIEAILEAVLKRARATTHPWLVACDANTSPVDFGKGRMLVVVPEGASSCRSKEAAEGATWLQWRKAARKKHKREKLRRRRGRRWRRRRKDQGPNRPGIQEKVSMHDGVKNDVKRPVEQSCFMRSWFRKNQCMW